MAGLGLLVLRLALAVVLVAHGAHDLFGMFSEPGVGPGGLSNTAAHFGALGLHPEGLIAALAGVIQFIGGVLIAFGLLTRWASIALLAYLGIELWKEQYRWGLFLNWTGASGHGHGMEYFIVLAAAVICLLLTGPGDWSFDGRRASSQASRAAGRARVARSAR